MRLDFPRDDDPRHIRRELPRDKPEPLMEPGPLDRRVAELADRAAQRRLPDIPRRQYEARQKPDGPQVDRESAERNVRSRHHLPHTIPGVRLHQEERRLLYEVGRFRVLSMKDAARTIYSGDEHALRIDLRFLKEQGMVSLDTVNARRDGRNRPVERLEVITLTRDGEKLARSANEINPDQKLYHGLVKPREVEHDSQIYRAYLKEWEKIERQGGENPRLKLDFEIKSEVQKAIHAARKTEPDRDLNEIKQQVAQEQNLPFVDQQIQIPDARIEYDLDQGSRTGFSDIEVVTAAYRPGHLHAKTQAGFHLYASGRDARAISAKIEDEHHLLDQVLDL
ncbi:MAG: hypothetical protein WDN23_18275 [Edaphobacter sp.]